jgi:hypothetical protein
MKCVFFVGLLLAVAAHFLFAQGLTLRRGQPIVGAGTRPPLSLPDAFAVAISYVGAATNRWWCTAASCSPDYGTTNLSHWEFGFANTNKGTLRAYVFFDKTFGHYDNGAIVIGQIP